MCTWKPDEQKNIEKIKRIDLERPNLLLFFIGLSAWVRYKTQKRTLGVNSCPGIFEIYTL
jgi:hypothetical protein